MVGYCGIGQWMSRNLYFSVVCGYEAFPYHVLIACKNELWYFEDIPDTKHLYIMKVKLACII